FKECQPINGNLVMRCKVLATPGTAIPPDSQVCGHWLGAKETIWVYLINGRPDANGMFSFGSGAQGSFIACSVSDPGKPDEWEWSALGAVGKCLLWSRLPRPAGWIPTPTTDSQLEFNACLRAIRADYCGDGVTHTVDGTRIDLYGAKENHVSNL